MAPIDPTRLGDLVDRLANALQSALLLSARLEPNLQQSSRDATELLSSVARATTALQDFRRDPDPQDKT